MKTKYLIQLHKLIDIEDFPLLPSQVRADFKQYQQILLPVNNSLIAFPGKRYDKTSVITSDIINEKFTISIEFKPLRVFANIG
jgi:hypothetical protein